MGKLSSILPTIVEGNRRFQEEVFRPNASAYHELTKGQQPRALYVGCSDSRVVPNLILDMAPGELFVLRNIGAIVPHPDDPSSASPGAAFDYAINGLGIVDIIVCGHDLCGALQAILSGQAPPGSHLDRWLRKGSRDVEGRDLLDAPAAMPVERLVEQFVLLQMRSVSEYPSVRDAGAAITVHGAVYDPAHGQLRVYDPVTSAFRVIESGRRISLAPEAPRVSDSASNEDSEALPSAV